MHLVLAALVLVGVVGEPGASEVLVGVELATIGGGALVGVEPGSVELRQRHHHLDAAR